MSRRFLIYKIGMDVGGTFTDFVVAEDGNQPRFFTTHSTPSDSSIAVMTGLQEAAAAYGVAALDRCSRFLLRMGRRSRKNVSRSFPVISVRQGGLSRKAQNPALGLTRHPLTKLQRNILEMRHRTLKGASVTAS